MPIYCYEHPKTGEIFEEIRSFSESDLPYVAEDGIECPRCFYYENKNICIIDKNAECFKKDADYVKKCRPKYVKFRDGHREKYDPTRHF